MDLRGIAARLALPALLVGLVSLGAYPASGGETVPPQPVLPGEEVAYTEDGRLGYWTLDATYNDF